MEYFKILNLTKEPFSNSPDPEFFYESPQHMECLQQVEMALRLRRGLNIVTGDVGTGKTTLCRQLIRQLAWDKSVSTHLVLDPNFDSPLGFLSNIALLFGIPGAAVPERSEWQFKEAIKNFLYRRSLEEGRLTVLIIDEGQAIPAFGLEILREFLNYETNEFKLLQIVIFAQKEFRKILRGHRGLTDRINLFFHLKPLSFKDCRAMILFRMDRAADSGVSTVRFTWPAFWEIRQITGGYPRKIVMLCHQIMLMLIIQSRTQVNWFLVRETHRRNAPIHSRIGYAARVGALSALLLLLVLVQFGPAPVREGIHSSLSLLRGGGPPAGREGADASRYPVKTANPAGEAVPKGEHSEAVAGETKPEAVLAAAVPIVATEPAKTAEAAEAPTRGATAPVPPAFPYPAVLGQLTVRQGDVIWNLMTDFYGGSSTRAMKLFREVNPHLKSIDRIVQGDVLNFPAIPAANTPPPWVSWVALAESGSLEEIFHLLRQYPGDLPPARIVSWWTGGGGLRFALVLRKSFTDDKAAWQAIDTLPERLSKNARIVSKWDEGTVFFSAFMTP